MVGRATVVAVTCVTLASLSIAATSRASYAGRNGRITVVRLSGAPGSTQDLFSIGPAGRNRKRLTGGPEDDAFPAYTSDGEHIAFSRGPPGSGGRGQIWVMDADGSHEHEITDQTPGVTDRDPSFSPSGGRIAFTRNDQIWIMNSDGTGQHRLTVAGANGDEGTGPTFSPDGRHIAYVHFDGTVGFHGISVMRPDGTHKTPLTTPSATTDDFQPDFSPDGGRIVFDRYRASQDDLFVMRADGSSPRPLTTGSDILDLSPAFAPDGSGVIFERDAPDFSVANIGVVDSRGTDRHFVALTHNEAPVQDFEPAWQALNPPSCRLDSGRIPRRRTHVALVVRCLNENSKMLVGGIGRAPGSDAGKFRIAAARFAVARNARKRIELDISRKGRRALAQAARAGRRSTVRIGATFTDDLGQASSDSLRIRLGRRGD